MKKHWFVLLALTTLAACGEEQKPYKPPLPHSGANEAAPKLFQEQREVLDSAKGVGQVLEQGAKERAEAAAKAAQ
jgi:predicted small lipoprotein YifL